MLAPGGRRRLVLVAAATVLTALSAFAAIRAQDAGAAWTTVLMGLVGIAVVTVPPLPSVRRLDEPELRARLRAAAESRLRAESIRHGPAGGRAAIRLSELVRVSTRTSHQGETTDLARLVEDTGGRVAVVGPAGSGKTTAAVDLLGQWLDAPPSGVRGALVPLYVRLSSWGDEEDLATWLTAQVRALTGLSARQAASALPLVVPILDGFDEVSEARRRRCAEALQEHLDRNRAALLVLTSRSPEFDAVSDILRSVRPLRLEPLDPAAISGLLLRDDPRHWAPVVAEIQREGSLLGWALQTPLMVQVVLDAWGHADPANLIEVSTRPGATRGAVTQMLWDRWLARAGERLSDASVSLAAALARSAQETGADEIRLEELGSRATRTAWWLLWGATIGGVGAALSSLPLVLVAVVGPLILALEGALRFWPRGSQSSVVRWGAMLLPGAAFGAAGYVTGLSGTDWWVPAVAGVVAGGVVAASDVEPAVSAWTARLSRVVAVRAWLTIAVTALAVAVLASTAALIEPAFAPVGVGLGLLVGYVADVEFGGHHLLVRTWWRLRDRGRPLGPRLAELAEAGLLRPSGAGFRFYHLELRDHLARRPPDGNPYRLDNAGQYAAFAKALDARSEEESIKLWDRYLARTPVDEAAVFNRALALERLGRLEEALDGFEAALRLRPRDVPDLRGCARLSLDTGRFEAAVGYARRFLEVAGDEPLMLGYLGTALLETGRGAQAREALDRAVALAPNAAVLLMTRAQVLDDLGAHELAEADRVRAHALDPDATTLLDGRRAALADVR